MLKKAAVKVLAYALATKDRCEIEKVISQYDIVSFDLFDTLVKRNVSCVRDIHAIVAQELKKMTGTCIENYVDKRLNAERRVRKTSSFAEITLNEIIEGLEDIQEKDRRLLYDLEIKTEIDHCCSCDFGHALFEYSLRNAGEVIITSDMYLPIDAIALILEKCGYDCVSNVFLSSVWRETKREGSLFNRVKSSYPKSKSFLHIGDNYRSDYISARKMGFQAVLVVSR